MILDSCLPEDQRKKHITFVPQVLMKIGGEVMDTKSGKRSDRTNDWLLNEILDAHEKGVTVAVDGKSYGIQDIPDLCGVMEAQEYMKSYVCDRSGKIVHIDFDQIIGV